MAALGFSRHRLALSLVGGALLAGCSAGAPANRSEPSASLQQPFSVGGCTCPQSGGCSTLSYTDIPANGQYYITTFTGGGMACGGTADGTWAYIADSARFGCGAHVLMQANGKQCVAQVADCGPNRCVEQAASYSSCSGHFPIIDSSPFITNYLYGVGSSGWSDKRIVTASLVSGSIKVGCPGGTVAPPDWGAQFLSQSFPYSSQGSIDMVVGQTLTESITLKNIGGKTWNSNTKLSPTPRDQASPFGDSSWLGPTRIVAAGSVAPGASHKFTFKLHATKAGTFSQYFGMVQEGVAWFSDPGQGGPPDNQLEAKIVVSKPPYAAKVVSTSFPPSGQALVMTAGSTATVDIQLKNIGQKSWDTNTRIGTTGPRDRQSPFADSSWLGASRPAAANGSIAPGSSFDFKFELRAPNQLGSYVEHYGVVEESVAWFSDAGQGGPADNVIALPIEVVAPGTTDAGTTPWDGGDDATFGSAGSDGGIGAGGTSSDAGNAFDGSGNYGESSQTLLANNSNGCSCRTVGVGSRDGQDLALFALLGLGLVVERRRRR